MQTLNRTCVLRHRILRCGWLSILAVATIGAGILATPAAANQIITGTSGDSDPQVKTFSGAGIETSNFFPYGGGFLGGVRVAAGDVNGDGTPDLVTGLSSGLTSHVKAFSGVDQSVLKSFFAYDPAFVGGVYVAAGDVDRDGLADIVTGAGDGGGTHVKVFSSATNSPLYSFFAYPGVDNEVRVAAGDVNGDGFADIITGLGPGSATHVKVFDGTNLSLLDSFFAFDAFTGGVYVAAGDVNNDGFADIITGAGVGGSTHVKVFSGNGGGLLYSFFAYPGADDEVRVGSGDVNGDGFADIITGLGPGSAAHVKVFSGDGLGLLQSFFAYPTYTGGLYVAGVSPVARVPEYSSLALVCAALSASTFRRGTGRGTRRRRSVASGGGGELARN